jgi:uncharacterized protein YkwD
MMKRIGIPVVVIALAAAFAGCGGDGTSTPGGGPSSDARVDGIKQEMLAAINAARSAPRTCGTTTMPAVSPLSWNDGLSAAALRHSLDMAANLALDHTGSDGSTPGDRITQAGYMWRSCGEDIASGYPTVSGVVSAWLASPGHCVIIMDAGFADIGAAYDIGSNSQRYWTLDLARPR